MSDDDRQQALCLTFVADQVLPLIDAFEAEHDLTPGSVDFRVFVMLARRLVSLGLTTEQVIAEVRHHAIQQIQFNETRTRVQ